MRGSIFRKSGRGVRVDSGAASKEYAMEPGKGGSSIKRIQLMVKQIQATTPATDKLSIKIDHSPDGNTFVAHTAYPALAAATDGLWVLDSDSTIALSEYWRVTIKTNNSAGESQLVDVFELGKPF